jgi:PKHD-type hydroxylase
MDVSDHLSNIIFDNINSDIDDEDMPSLISDSNDYEGGEFEIWMGGKDGFVTVPREKGDVIIFPAFCMHRVKPITKGQRKCLVFWTGGRPFR